MEKRLARRLALEALGVLAQFVVAGGFTRAIDAWVVDLDPAWQLMVLVLSQLTIAFAQAYLEEHRVIPPVLRPAPRSRNTPTPPSHNAR